MRARYFAATLLLAWIAAESQFSPSFFWLTVQNSLSETMSSFEAAFNEPEPGHVPVVGVLASAPVEGWEATAVLGNN